MANELEIRAQIDTENVKSLLLINGGASVALLALLSRFIGAASCEPLTQGILSALLAFQVGLVVAIVHNRLRRKCSQVYQSHGYKPPPCKFLGMKLKEPCICHVSIIFMWGSLLAFIVGISLVYFGAHEVIGVCNSGGVDV
jgi:hypothetical protein